MSRGAEVTGSPTLMSSLNLTAVGVAGVRPRSWIRRPCPLWLAERVIAARTGAELRAERVGLGGRLERAVQAFEAVGGAGDRVQAG